MPPFSPSLPALCFEQNPSDVPWCGVAFLRRMSSFQPVVVAHNAEKVMLRFMWMMEQNEVYRIIYWILIVKSFASLCKKVERACNTWALCMCHPRTDLLPIFPPLPYSSFTQDWRSMVSGTYDVGKQRHKQSITHPSRTSGIISNSASQSKQLWTTGEHWRRTLIVVVAEPSGGRYMTGMRICGKV